MGVRILGQMGSADRPEKMDEKLKSKNMSKKSIFQYFSLDLNEARDDGVPGCNGISWTICKQSAPRSRQDNHSNTPSLNFYRPDALPDKMSLQDVQNYLICRYSWAIPNTGVPQTWSKQDFPIIPDCSPTFGQFPDNCQLPDISNITGNTWYYKVFQGITVITLITLIWWLKIYHTLAR